VIPVSTFEDALLNALWKQRDGCDWWLVEVPIGYADAPPNSRRHRRIDAVVLDSETPEGSAASFRI
jgi:hypothetical protein